MNSVVNEIKKVEVFYIATMEKNQPRVRPFSSVTEFEGNAYICTGRKKEIFRQLQETPYIELCGSYDMGSWLRVSAKVELDNRIEAEAALLSDPTGPSQLYKPGDGNFAAFRLTNVKAYKYNFYSAPTLIKEHD